jgi:hypothetical protein
VTSLRRRLPTHQGFKGLCGLLQQPGCFSCLARLPIQYELTLAPIGWVSRCQHSKGCIEEDDERWRDTRKQVCDENGSSDMLS